MYKFLPFFFFVIPIPATVYAYDTWTSVQPSFNEVTITGFSKARHTMTLSTEVSGKVEQVFADIGDMVPKSGIIACLDSTFNKLDINTAKNQIAQFQVDINYFTKQVNRYQDLVSKNSVAVSQLDDFKRQLANSKLQKLKHIINKQRLEEKQKRYCIKASSGWQVVERYIEVGQWLAVGKPIAKIGNYAQLLVPLSLTVNELNALNNQLNNLQVKLPEFNQFVPATIEHISPAFDDQSRKVQLDLLLEKNLPVSRGGLRVEVNLKLADSENTFLVSEAALDKRFEEVWIERQEAAPVRVDLLGHTENGLARIASPDLKTGDLVKILKP